MYQLIVEENHGVIPYPEWSNTTDFIPTEEGFGTVPLQSVELGEAIRNINIDTAQIKLQIKSTCANLWESSCRCYQWMDMKNVSFLTEWHCNRAEDQHVLVGILISL